MSRDNKILLAALAGGSVLVPAVLGLGLSWPPWAWGLFAALLLAAVAAYGRHVLQRQRQDALHEALLAQRRAPAAPEPEPEPFQPRQVRDVPLPSSEADYRFVFSATVWWRRPADAVGVGHENPAELAVETVLSRARLITAGEHPAGRGAIEHRLAAALGAVTRDEHRHIEAWAADLALTLPEVDADRLRRLAEVRKDEQVWQQERDHERNKRAYLADEVLRDTGSAVVWWLARHDDEVERAAELIGTLAQLSAAANGTEIAEQFRHLVPASRQAPFQNGRPLRAESLSFTGSLEGGSSYLSYGELSAGGEFSASGELAAGALRPGEPTGDAERAAIEQVDGLLRELDPETAERSGLADRLAALFDSAGQQEFADSIRQRYGEPGVANPATADAGPPWADVPPQPNRSST